MGCIKSDGGKLIIRGPCIFNTGQNKVGSNSFLFSNLLNETLWELVEILKKKMQLTEVSHFAFCPSSLLHVNNQCAPQDRRQVPSVIIDYEDDKENMPCESDYEDLPSMYKDEDDVDDDDDEDDDSIFISELRSGVGDFFFFNVFCTHVTWKKR